VLSILKWCVSGRPEPILQWQNSWFYRLRWQPYLNGKITTPGVQLPIRKSVSTDMKELERIWCCFLKSQTLLCYKQTTLSRY
jgi:hypothetical protein